MSNGWWGLAQESDVSSIPHFEEETEALKAMLEQQSKVPASSEAMKTAIKWLDNVTAPGERERWVRSRSDAPPVYSFQ